MSYVFRITHIIILGVITDTVDGRRKFNAVSAFSGIEELHIHARNKEPNSNLKYLFKTTRKCDICEDIFSSGYFKYLATKRIYGYIRRYRTPKTRVINVYNTVIEDILVENAFSCPTKGVIQENKKIKYFVSAEYNVNDYASSSQYIAGRFVFKREHDTFSYEALAEEPASIVEGKNVEQLYLETRVNHAPADTFSEDPLCRLDVQKKLRICTLVMSSSYFVGKKYYFASSLDRVYGKCHKRRIKFRTDYAKKEIIGKTFEEWTMMCHTNSPETTQFHLSRAYESHKLFVYATEMVTGRLFLEVLASNIRGVIDEIAPNEN